MRITSSKILIVITIFIFLFTWMYPTATYNSEPFGSKTCCPKNMYEETCDYCEYNTCCEYTYIDYNFALIPYAVFEKPWTLITVMFLHADFWHILFNMIGLILFGIYLEKVVGQRNFLLIYFAGGITASIIYVPFAVYFDEIFIPMVGASGAIYAVIIALMIIRPFDEIFSLKDKGFRSNVSRVFVFGLEGFLPLFFVGLLYMAIAISGLLVDFMLGGQTGVANAAHFGGAIGGIIIGFYFRGTYGKDPEMEVHQNRRRQESLERMYDEIEEAEGARSVRLNEYGRYEYAGEQQNRRGVNERMGRIANRSDEDELEIADEMPREHQPQQMREEQPQMKRNGKRSDKNSDDELEIID